MSRLAILALFGLLSWAAAQVTFTGNVPADFAKNKLPLAGQNQLLFVNSTFPPVIPSITMQQKGVLASGIEVLAVYFQYEFQTDTLYVGIDCNGICGDVDGDGDPGASNVDPDATDNPDLCFSEQISLMLHPNAQAEGWVPNPNDETFFFPTIIIGVPLFDCIDTLQAAEFAGSSSCPWSFVKNNPSTPCAAVQKNRVRNPGDEGYGSKLVDLYPGLLAPEWYPASPDASKPDLEIKLKGFSQYPGFTFTPGADPIDFGFSLFSGSATDTVGEDRVPPGLFTVPCANVDVCGVCAGDNTTCEDCAGTPNGNAEYDQCGVCNGDDTSCADCAGIPNGDGDYDACGVCNGDSTTCADCTGTPNGDAVYDDCGVCDGDSTSCADCTGTPNGDAVYDDCGVCDGDSTSCADCTGTPNGDATYDACGVCDGDSTSCADCTGTPNGDAVYDACGVCDGDSTSCVDCTGTPNGDAVYDDCGVCDGDSTSCADCAGTPNGDAVYDRCGVCDGDGTSCGCSFDSSLMFEAVDSWIEQCDREANHGTEALMHVEVSENQVSRSVIQFDGVVRAIRFESRVPQGFGLIDIHSAFIRLFVRSVSADGWEYNQGLGIYRLKKAFAEKEVSWACATTEGCCDSWTMIELDEQFEVDYTEEPAVGVYNVTASAYPQQWPKYIDFDVKDLIYDLLENEPYCVHLPFLLKKVCEEDTGSIEFWTSESRFPPILSVDFTTTCPVNPPEPEIPCEDKDPNISWNWDESAN